MTETTVTAEPRSLGSLIGTLVTVIEKGSPGDAAALRRIDVDHPTCAAFWKLTTAFLSDRRLSGEDETRWAVVLTVLAHAGSLHQPGYEQSLGRVLAKVGFSELRFTRLYRATGGVLLNEAMLLGRLLAAKAEPVDLTSVARLVLSDGRADEENVRRNLARDYFGALARKA